MEILVKVIKMFLHLDKHLNIVIQNYGVWTYLIIFLIVFCETGLVITPLLPGDSLLFAAGSFAGMGMLDVRLLFLLLSAAAILGDSVNYYIGRYMGPKVFQKGNSRIFKKEYLDKTHKFYEKYGGKTIILARFIPIFKTFSPFFLGGWDMFFCGGCVFKILWGGG